MSVNRVVRAWVIRGPRPDIHQEQMNRLYREWPELALSLDELTNEFFNEQVKEE